MGFKTNHDMFVAAFNHNAEDALRELAVLPFAYYKKLYGVDYEGGATNKSAVKTLINISRKHLGDICGSILHLKPEQQKIDEYLCNVPDGTGLDCHYMGVTLKDMKISDSVLNTYKTINNIVPELDVDWTYGISEAEMAVFINELRSSDVSIKHEKYKQLLDAGVPADKVIEVIWLSIISGYDHKYLSDVLVNGAGNPFIREAVSSLGAGVKGAAIGYGVIGTVDKIDKAKAATKVALEAEQEAKVAASAYFEAAGTFNGSMEAFYEAEQAHHVASLMMHNTKEAADAANAAANSAKVVGEAALAIAAVYVGSKAFKYFATAKRIEKVKAEDMIAYSNENWNGYGVDNNKFINSVTTAVNLILDTSHERERIGLGAYSFKAKDTSTKGTKEQVFNESSAQLLEGMGLDAKDQVYDKLAAKGIPEEEYETKIDEILGMMPKSDLTKDRYIAAAKYIDYI